MNQSELEAYDAMIADRDRWREKAEHLAVTCYSWEDNWKLAVKDICTRGENNLAQLREPLEAPRDGTFILGAFGWPWLVPAVWNSYDHEWVVCHMQAQQMANGLDDRWLEMEREKALSLTGWLPVPPLPGGYVFRPANDCLSHGEGEKRS